MGWTVSLGDTIQPLGAKFTPVANLTSIGKLMLLNTGLCRRGLVVSSPPATEVTGAMGREIESRQVGSFLKVKNWIKLIFKFPRSSSRLSGYNITKPEIR
jgi:hypothetical protein